jgi:septal ring factor EnvC (AmiA/AmiB activator)
MKKSSLQTILIILIVVAGCPTCQAVWFHDAIHTVENIATQIAGQLRQELQHAESIAKYAEMIRKQTQQIQQLTMMINQNVEQLRRIGDPNTYINMLGLDALFNEMSRIKNGIGSTVAEFQQTADGMMALKYTANGLYQDISRMPDRFGKTVQYDANSFKQFGAVQDMYRSFNTELEQANQSLAVLYQEKEQTLKQLNSAGSLIEEEKYKAKLQAVQASIDNVIARTNMAAQKVLVQHAANQNDQARMQQAMVQQRLQEVEEENLLMQQNASRMVLGLK